MSYEERTFSLSGRATNRVSPHPVIIGGSQTPLNNSTPEQLPYNAPRLAASQMDIRSLAMMPRRKARAIARSQTVTTDSEDVPASITSPSQTSVTADRIPKIRKGRGCNKGEQPPKDRADRRRISLTPLGGWPDKLVPRTIGSHIKTGLKGGHPNWTMVPTDNKRTLWNRFEGTYVWDPAEAGAIKALWEKSISDSLSDAVYDVTKEKPEWCADQHWNELLAYWESPDFIKRSKSAKANKSKVPKASHTTGSKTMERAGIEKALEQGIPAIPFIENFANFHMKRNPSDPNAAGNWIDPKFKAAHDQYVEDCTKEFGEDRTLWLVEVDPKKWTHAIGSPEKGRIMGFSGHVYPETLGFNTRKRKLFPRVTSSAQDSQTEVEELKDKLEQVKKTAEELLEKNAELQALVKRQAAQHEEMLEIVRSLRPDYVGPASIREVRDEGERNNMNDDFFNELLLHS